MKGNWKERRRMEIIRHINDVMTGIMLILMIGIVGNWDLYGDIGNGQFVIFVIAVCYIIAYCTSRYKFFIKED